MSGARARPSPSFPSAHAATPRVAGSASPRWRVTAARAEWSGGTERREWRKFKNERVKEAVDEINRETDLEIELIEHKQGRAVVDVQFAVRRKKRTSAWQDVAPVDASLALRAESLGIREAKLEGLVQEFGEENVRNQLVQLERRAGNPRLRSLDNPYSYLRNGPSPEPSPETVEPSGSAAPPAKQWVDADGERIAKRIAELKLEIGRLAQSQRKLWADRALEELSRKGQLNAVVTRRAEQGDVLHGLLGATVVKMFAEATYGEGWANPVGDAQAA